MNDALYLRHLLRQPGRISVRLALLVWLLIGIRCVAAFGAYTCNAYWEVRTTRTAYILHAAGSHSHCQHGKSTGDPFVGWACTVYQDDQMLLLPEIPRLPVQASVLALLVLLIISFSGRALIAAHGRGPPLHTPIL